MKTVEYVRCYQKGKLNSVLFREEGKEIWASTTEKVIEFVKSKNLPDAKRGEKGVQVEIEYTEKDGRYFVTMVKPLEEIQVTTEFVKTEAEGKKCKQCGKPVKGKYDVCYTCFQVKPSEEKSKPVVKNFSGVSSEFQKSKSPEDIAIMFKCNCMTNASNAVSQALCGQISDVTTLANMIVDVYKILLTKIQE